MDFTLPSTRSMVRLTLKTLETLSPSPRISLRLARIFGMWNKPRAARHLNHYLSGAGKTVTVETSELLRQDSQVFDELHSRILADISSGRTQGTTLIPQWVFSKLDWRYALGSVRFVWEKTAGNLVQISFRERYAWRPSQNRITQPLHRAAETLKEDGAKEFFILGLPCQMALPSSGSIRTPRIPLDKQYLL